MSKCSKIGNTLLTRIRLERSYINLHALNICHFESADSLCHAKNESSFHYLIDSFLYSSQRQTLFNQVKHYFPNFKQLNKNKKYEVLVLGIHPENPDYFHTNTQISIAVQHFILKTNRFSEFSP